MRLRPFLFSCLLSTLLLAGCGDSGGAQCDAEFDFIPGDDGHADPLGVLPGEARAGRLTLSDLPPQESGVSTYEPGDFVLVNEHIALIIEEAGPSDLYDPWGGKPVGMARVSNGQLIEAGDYGETLLLSGRFSLVADRVTVINDGSDGNAAVVRAHGTLAPTPFMDPIASGLLTAEFSAYEAAIEYVLEPDTNQVEIYIIYQDESGADDLTTEAFYGFLYAKRMPPWVPEHGFDLPGFGANFPLVAFVDEKATSWALSPAGGGMAPFLDVSGFRGMFGATFTVEGCAETRRHFGTLTLGGPGLDPLLQAVRVAQGRAERTISGVVRDASLLGAPVEGARVHATSTVADEHLTRSAITDATGAFTVHVDADLDVNLTAWRRGDALSAEVLVPVGTSTADVSLMAGGWVDVTVTDLDSGLGLPVRVQVTPNTGSPPSAPSSFGEGRITSGRVQVAYPVDGHVLMRLPAGQWDVMASRGFEYTLDEATVTISQADTELMPETLAMQIEHVVDTDGVMCADFHIHTYFSNDSADPGLQKLQSAIADGLEIAGRSEHEFVQSFDAEIQALDAAHLMVDVPGYVYGVTSVEFTTMEVYGHFGVVPLVADPAELNNGTPFWQTYPTLQDPTIPVETILPPAFLASVRARPEQPTVIVNHPMGETNYFGAAGFDPATGTVERPELWDEEFTLVEVFNSSDWGDNRDGTVAAWLGLLESGRDVFAVGASDSHAISSSPVGYPRTCIRFPDAVDMMSGEDDPRMLTPEMVRDQLDAGMSTVSGGVFIRANVGGAEPGQTATGVGMTATLDVEVQAAPWVDVDELLLIVDGVEYGSPVAVINDGSTVVRYDSAGADATFSIPVAATGSYVIVVAQGDSSLAIHPGRGPFGVANPIFLER